MKHTVFSVTSQTTAHERRDTSKHARKNPSCFPPSIACMPPMAPMAPSMDPEEGLKPKQTQHNTHYTNSCPDVIHSFMHIHDNTTNKATVCIDRTHQVVHHEINHSRHISHEEDRDTSLGTEHTRHDTITAPHTSFNVFSAPRDGPWCGHTTSHAQCCVHMVPVAHTHAGGLLSKTRDRSIDRFPRKCCDCLCTYVETFVA